MKLVKIKHCYGCPHAAFMFNEGYVVSKNEGFEPIGDRTRIYVGCHAVSPPRSFDYGAGVFSPKVIPDWCPLPDAPEKKQEEKPEG